MSTVPKYLMDSESFYYNPEYPGIFNFPPEASGLYQLIVYRHGAMDGHIVNVIAPIRGFDYSL